MRVGQRVRTAISLPGIPTGTVGAIKEVGRVFVVVGFDDGRQGYYAPRQLTAEGCCGKGEGASDQDTAPLGVADARVPRGSHVCMFPGSREAAVNAVARFAAAGARNGELAVCIVPATWTGYLSYCLSQLGVDLDSTGQGHDVRIVRSSEVYLSASKFTASAQTARVSDMLTGLVAQEGRPVRACGSVRGRHQLPEWWEYEDQVTKAARESGAICLCVYGSARLSSRVWERAAPLHDLILTDNEAIRGGLSVT